MAIFHTTINTMLDAGTTGRFIIYTGNDMQLSILNVSGGSFIPWITHHGSTTLRIETGTGILKYVEDNKEMMISLALGTFIIIPKGIPYMIQNSQWMEHLKILETMCATQTVSFNIFN